MSRTAATATAITSTTGFTMIEVLLSMLLLGSGALALVMMQLQALRIARGEQLRSQAVMMVSELAELRAEAALPATDERYLFRFDSRNGNIDTAPDCRAQSCSRPDFAAANVAAWQARLAQALPGARAVVCRDASSQARNRWDCDDQPGAPVLAKLGWRSGAPDAAPALTVFIGH